MPIYLCQPGTGSKEPWRHGVQVYARPFPLGGESESDNDDDGDVDPVATREAERVALASVAGTADASTATAAAAAAASAVATPRGEGVGVSGPANDAAGGAHARGESNDIHVAREGRGRLEAQDDSDLQGGPLLQQHEQQQVQERRLEMQVIRQRRFAAARALDNSTFSNSNSSLEDEINSDHDNDNNNNVNNDNNNNNQSQQELQLRNSQMQQRRQQRQLQNLQGQQHRHHRKLRHQRQRRLPPVRRVRHAEVVLVDQVLVAFRRYWLRLRWPGEHGGFGGFVALGKLEEYLSDGGMAEGKASGKGGTRYDSVGNHDVNFDFGKNSSGETEVVADLETLSKSASTAEKHTANVPLLLCQETNVPYPSSLAMKLLPRYDDGLEMDCGTAAAADDSNMLEESLLGSLKNGEPVFCRICREGLHDVNYDLETATSAAPQNKADEDLSSHTVDAMRRGTDSSAGVETPEFAGGASDGRDEGAVTAESTIAAISSNLATATTSGDDQQLSSTTTESKTSPSTKTPSFPLANLPPLVLHHPTAENPLLAPCKCAGSMAFVHYLCIEQWRCRSRHPAAKNGLHCETCGAEYTLPPPPSRPTHPNDPFHNNNGEEPGNIMFEDDWLAAMPPHVLAALRRPHPWWQLGAAIVRRKYLRPLVPVFLSPLVALYCRGRRTLKKRGVSRRRWACSLCRRRARWKCVRCLRSYYCSRQCQNVSWHIVHKHVCYKPARFWWSVVVYSVGGVLAVPGVLKEPLVYDFMLTFLPVNFLAMGIIAGGIATDMKRLLAVDIRGRTLEMFVVLLTLWLTFVTSKLVRGYFGDPSQCWGVFASNGVSSGHADESDETTLFRDNIHLPDPSNPVSLFSSPFNFLHGSISNILFFIAVSFLRISQIWFEKWDYYVFSRLGFISRRIICTPTPDGSTDYMNDGCFPSVRNIDPNFFLEEGNESCRADMSLMLFLYLGALAFLAYGSLDRHRRGRVRNAGGQRGHRERRPHQD